MRLIELDTQETRSDVAAALERASADVPEAERRLKKAEAALAKAESERQRCDRMLGDLNAKLASNMTRVRGAKQRALSSAANQTADMEAYQAYTKLKDERAWLTDVLQYVSVFASPDSNRALIVAQIDERTAYADLLESRAARARLGMLVAASQAMQYDPGATIDVETSWSSAVADEARQIRARVIPDLEKQLADHDRRVAEHRALVDASLWS
jgi:chromosome segregation ATPase